MKLIKIAGIIIICGLITSQIIATIHVFISNQGLIDRVTELNKAGLITIPGYSIASQIGLTEAFFGGFFFTVSIGLAITFIWILAITLWRNFLNLSRYPAFLFIGGWILLVGSSNYKVLFSVLTCYLIIIPLVISIVSIKLEFHHIDINRKKLSIFSLVFVLFSVICGSQFSIENAISIRDNILLTNKVGQAINRFYYDYTLYAAQVIKPLAQKSNKTVYLKDINNSDELEILQHVLSNNEYLIVKQLEIADLVLKTGKHQLFFYNKKQLVLTIPIDRFLLSPILSLRQFSQNIDPNTPFRQFIKISIIIALFGALYLGVILISYLLSYFCGSAIFSSFVYIVMFSGITVCLVLISGNRFQNELSAKNISASLRSPELKQRLLALKAITFQKLELADYPSYKTLIRSNHIPERLWLTRAATISQQKESQSVLVAYIADVQANIACQALRGLSSPLASSLTERLLLQLKTNKNWYVQLCTYQALKSHQWKQNTSH